MAVAAASNCKMVQIADWPVRLERGHLIVDGAKRPVTKMPTATVV
jgi:hypothetical protein